MTTLLVLAAVYFLPTIVAVFRWKGGRSPARRILLFGIINFFIGWTGVGWIACWFLMFWKGFEGFLDRLAAGASASGYSAPSGASPSDWRPTGGAPRCTSCGGAGTMRCPQCGGRGSWYDPPTTANGVAQLNGCNYCMRSGTIRCQGCGG